jgi:hypothetical protein
MSDRLTSQQESMIRKLIAVRKGEIDEYNKMLIAGNCEPEPETIMTDVKLVAYGIKGKVKGGFRSFLDGVKTGMANVKATGQEEVVEKEINNQIDEQVKKMREDLAKALKK